MTHTLHKQHNKDSRENYFNVVSNSIKYFFTILSFRFTVHCSLLERACVKKQEIKKGTRSPCRKPAREKAFVLHTEIILDVVWNMMAFIHGRIQLYLPVEF